MALQLPSRDLAEFCERNHITRVLFFGSVLREDFRPESDIDVLIEFEPGHIPGLKFFRMEQELSKILNRRVDLNTPNFLSPHFREKVLSEAELIYGR